MRRNPCYDPIDKTDCPRRCVGCAINCPDWAAYVAERDKVYEERKNQWEISSIVRQAEQKRITKKTKSKMRR